ncbi:SIS domain-containing protein [Actibacterium sp. 188UL27-1]|nr:SIS domain-containing protein [Actibacterium sp. 188UL27-1]
MRAEIAEIPQAVDRLLTQGGADVAAIARVIRQRDPAFIVTVARGSSDHICTYLKYAAELLLGVPVASIGPSIASIYGAQLKVAGSLSLAVSQSGKSPDIVEMSRSAGAQGALTVAVTNTPGAPLSANSAHTIDIHAGPEHSVAATKTFVTSAVAGLLLLAEWKQDRALIRALRNLPDHLDRAVAADWSPVEQALDGFDSLFTLGRGPVWAMSNEAALKFKETCQIHAESYSSAEVLHGPVSIVGDGFPVLCFAAGDAAETAVADIADRISAKGARVFVTSDRAQAAQAIPTVRTDHPLTDPIALITSFYAMVERVALARGIDPDTPRHLQKVTQTT